MKFKGIVRADTIWIIEGLGILIYNFLITVHHNEVFYSNDANIIIVFKLFGSHFAHQGLGMSSHG